MDFSDYDIKIINPISPIHNTNLNNRKQKDQKQKSRLKQYKKEEVKDTYIPSDNVMITAPTSLYNSKGQLYAKDNFYKHLTAELNKIIKLDETNEEIEDARAVDGPEYARTFLVLNDLPKSNRFKYLFDDSKIINKTVMDKDIRTVLPTTPCYMSDESYTAYVNQNPNSEMYQQVINNKPRQVVHNIKDYTEKYLQPPTFYSFKEHKI